MYSGVAKKKEKKEEIFNEETWKKTTTMRTTFVEKKTCMLYTCIPIYYGNMCMGVYSVYSYRIVFAPHTTGKKIQKFSRNRFNASK